MTDNVAQESAASKRGAEFSRLNRQGLTYSQIAKMYGTSRAAVAGAIHRYEKPDHVLAYQRGLYAPIKAQNQAFRMEIISKRVAAAVPACERDERVLALYRTGMSMAAIAPLFGLSRQRIKQIIDRCVIRSKVAA